MKAVLIILFQTAALTFALAQGQQTGTSSTGMSTTETTTTDSSKVTLRQEDNELVPQPQPELVKVAVNDLPEALRKTLNESDRYKGWQNAVIHKYAPANEYMLVMGNGKKSVTYHFNEQGELIEKDKNSNKRSKIKGDN